MTLAEKLEMIKNNEEAMKEAEELFNEIQSYVRTVELIWHKYFA